MVANCLKMRLAKDDDNKPIAKIHIDNCKNIYSGIFPSDYLDGIIGIESN
jgi:hypothetical protein